MRVTDIQLCIPSTTVVHKNSLLLHPVDRPGALHFWAVDSFHHRTRPAVLASVEVVDRDIWRELLVRVWHGISDGQLGRWFVTRGFWSFVNPNYHFM